MGISLVPHCSPATASWLSQRSSARAVVNSAASIAKPRTIMKTPGDQDAWVGVLADTSAVAVRSDLLYLAPTAALFCAYGPQDGP